MKYVLIGIIKFYKKIFSPLKNSPTCRFSPCCSSYAIGAIEKFGALRGSALALWRILRCNPFSSGGYDPVPEKFTFKKTDKMED